MERIISKKNPYIKFLASINKKGAKSPFIVIEGKKITEEAILSGVLPEAILISDNFKDNYLLEKLKVNDIRIIEVSEEIISHICDTKTPQGIASVVKKNNLEIKDKDIINNGFYIILEGVSDPGNVGTIIRSAEAFCVDGIFLCGGCADIYNPKVVRSTMGGIFRTKLYNRNDTNTVIGLLKSKGLKIYGAALCEDSIGLQDNTVELKDGAVVIGSESRGILEATLKLCDYKIKIPMSGATESLNAAVAGSLIMWEAFKQRKLL